MTEPTQKRNSKKPKPPKSPPKLNKRQRRYLRDRERFRMFPRRPVSSIPIAATEHAQKRIQRRYRYLFRGRVLGVLEWICPSCGYYNRSRLTRTTWIVRCIGAIKERHDPATGQLTYKEICRLQWGLGLVLHELPNGPRLIPEDTILPDNLQEAFPEGDTARFWTSGKLAHCLHSVTGQLAVPDFARTEEGLSLHSDDLVFGDPILDTPIPTPAPG